MAAPAIATAQDEPNALPGIAVLGTGLPINGIIHTAGDVDYFTFPAYAGETFAIGTGGIADTIITLFDRDGNQLLEDDDGGAALLSLLQWTVPQSGTYHVRVRLFSAAETDKHYQLFITPKPVADETNALPGVATPSDGTPSIGYIHVVGDQDLYSFTGTMGQPLSVSTLGPIDTIVSVLSPNGTTVLTSNDDGGLGFCSLTTFTPAATTTHFVRVNEFGPATGPYYLRVGPPVDDFPNSAGFASLGLNRPPTIGFLELGGDVDWLRIEATAGETYTFATDGEVDTIVTLFDTDGTSQLAEDDDGGPGLLSLLVWNAPATGIYHVRVRSFNAPETGAWYLTADN